MSRHSRIRMIGVLIALFLAAISPAVAIAQALDTATAAALD
jgi:hypothetical protein